MTKRICKVDGCDKPHHSNGYCGMHDARMKRHGSLNASRKERPVCSVEGCNNLNDAKTYCATHYARFKKTGSPYIASRKVTLQRDLDLWMEKFDRERSWETSSECIIWPFGKDQGYGAYRGKPAHRFMLQKYKGEPESDKLHAAHCPYKCSNKDCVNPNHLRWATPKENSRDNFRNNLKSKTAKLTETQVMEIYQDFGKHVDIANQYSVSRPVVTNIKNGKSWGWATEGLARGS